MVLIATVMLLMVNNFFTVVRIDTWHTFKNVKISVPKCVGKRLAGRTRDRIMVCEGTV
jgi:uncharacterized protein YqfA (UPF0365 family)